LTCLEERGSWRSSLRVCAWRLLAVHTRQSPDCTW
jgi:hypothetical protein